MSNQQPVDPSGHYHWDGAQWVPRQPQQATPASPARRRSWPLVVAIVGGVLLVPGLLFAGCAALVVGASVPTVETTPPARDEPVAAPEPEAPAPEPVQDEPVAEKPPAPPKPPGIGQPVRDGSFEFTVRSIDCNRRTVGQEPLVERAQGRFCVVKMDVKNIGDQAKFLDATFQYAYDDQDRKYETNSSAAVFIEDSNVFLEEINPGNGVAATMAFDVPRDAKIVRLELHDSLLSGGAEVAVG